MNDPERSLSAGYFDALYAENPDPWHFETSPYEAAKYRATVEALPRPRYRRAFEIGCSIGVLTRRLATRCAHLLAVDVSPAALARARERNRDLPHVHFERRSIPEAFPEGPFDLVVLSEVGYYWSRRDLARARAGIAHRLEPKGHLLLVHWTPYVEDYPLTGDAVHEAFLEDAGTSWTPLQERREATYRLNLFERTPDAGT